VRAPEFEVADRSWRFWPHSSFIPDFNGAALGKGHTNVQGVFERGGMSDAPAGEAKEAGGDMMSATGTLKIACPGCRAKYRISSEFIGKKLRCKKCQQAFRVKGPGATPAPQGPQTRASSQEQPKIFHPPTEDDIYRWLMEGMDEDVPARPRIANAAPRAAESTSSTSCGVERAASSASRRSRIEGRVSLHSRISAVLQEGEKASADVSQAKNSSRSSDARTADETPLKVSRSSTESSNPSDHTVSLRKTG